MKDFRTFSSCFLHIGDKIISMVSVFVGILSIKLLITGLHVCLFQFSADILYTNCLSEDKFKNMHVSEAVII